MMRGGIVVEGCNASAKPPFPTGRSNRDVCAPHVVIRMTVTRVVAFGWSVLSSWQCAE